MKNENNKTENLINSFFFIS